MFKQFFEDKLGQAFSIDALFALIIITIVIGVSANALDMAGSKITDYSSQKSLDRITADAADILVNTPGSPDDWEKNNFSTTGVTPGLVETGSKNGNTKILSLKKIYKLQNKYEELMEGKIIPNGAKSSLIIYPTDPTFPPLEIMDETSLNESKEISVANRTVLCDFAGFFTIYSTIVMNEFFNAEFIQIKESCPHHNFKDVIEHKKPDFNLKTQGWICNHFKVTLNDLNSTDFYLMTDPIVNDDQARWILDRPENMTDEEQKFNSNPILLNNRISELLGEESAAVLWLHVFTSGDGSKLFNVYLVGVPKGTPLEEIKVEYMNLQPCFFVLKVSM